jgi:hypothetical protein
MWYITPPVYSSGPREDDKQPGIFHGTGHHYHPVIYIKSTGRGMIIWLNLQAQKTGLLTKNISIT